MDELTEVERRLRDQLTALMDVSTVAEAEAIRREVLDLEPYICVLDSDVPEQWAVRRLYGYVDWRSKDTVEHETRWLVTEQAAIDRRLLSVLDQSRRGVSAEEVRRARAAMPQLLKRIGRLEQGADRAQALRCLWDYTNTTSSNTLAHTELAEQQRYLHRRRATHTPATPEREVLPEREYPQRAYPEIELFER